MEVSVTMWQSFRNWRRSRPFWGGLLVALAGLEFFISTQLTLPDGSTISIGMAGVQAIVGYLFIFLMLLTGVLSWLMPVQRHFYGLLAVFLAVLSLLGINLGGFFLGMLLGIIGGSLIFSWSTTTGGAQREDEPRGDDDDTSSDVDGMFDDPRIDTSQRPGMLRDGVPAPRQAADDQVQPQDQRHGPRHAAMAAVAVSLGLSLLFVVGGPRSAEAAGCGTTAKPSASASPSASPTNPGIIGGIIDWFNQLLHPPKPTLSPSPVPTAPSTPCPTPTGSKPTGATPSAGTSASPSVSASATSSTPGATRSATASVSPSAKPEAKILDLAPGQGAVAARAGRMTGTRVTMFNLVFDGVVELPKAGGSTVRVLQFSMSQSDTEDFKLHLFDGNLGKDTELTSSKLTVKGNTVKFYTSRFQAKLLGLIPVDYTPDSLPPPIPLPIIFFTDPDIQLVYVQAPTLLAPDLRINLVKAVP